MTQTQTINTRSVNRSKLIYASVSSSGCSHSWTYKANRNEEGEVTEEEILIHKQPVGADNHLAHVTIWGEWVWNEPLRGYYHEGKMSISAHHIDPDKLAKLERMIIQAFKQKGLEIVYASWGTSDF